MKITKILFSLFIFQSLLMAYSLSYDVDVINVVGMVLYVSFLIVLGSFVGEFFFRSEKTIETTELFLKNVLIISLIVSLSFFVIKLLLHYQEIDFNSYSAIRASFLLRSHGVVGVSLQLSLWLGLISSGCLLADKLEKNESGFDVTYLLIAGGLLVAIFFTGSRSVVLLFVAAYTARSKSLFSFLKTIKSLYIFLTVASFLLLLGYLRGISFNHMLTPLDSFVVGPHLLYQNIDVIIGQREYLDSRYLNPPGYALFSGFYIFLNIIFSYVDIEVFKHHLEAVFWKRHNFDYIPAFNNEYNSYYTVGLAVVIEGWVRIGVMSFLLGVLPHLIKNNYLKIILASLLFLFSFSLFRVSVFQNYSLAALFIAAVFIDAISRIHSNIKNN